MRELQQGIAGFAWPALWGWDDCVICARGVGRPFLFRGQNLSISAHSPGPMRTVNPTRHREAGPDRLKACCRKAPPLKFRLPSESFVMCFDTDVL